MSSSASPCASCGTPIPAAGRFCPECGKAAPPAVAAVAPVPAPAPVPVPTGSRAKFWIFGFLSALLLAFLLLWAMSAMNAAPAATAQTVLVDAAVTNLVDPETFEVLGDQHAFAPDEPSLYAVVTANVPQGGGTISVVWFLETVLQGETPLRFEGGDQERQVAHWRLDEGERWPVGHYRAKILVNERHVHTVHFNVTAEALGASPATGSGSTSSPGSTRASWDAAYDEATGFWHYRVLVRNHEPHALTDIRIATWTNLSDEPHGYEQIHEGLSVPAQSSRLFVVKVLHPSNDPGRNLALALHVEGGAPLAPLHETRSVFYNVYGGGGTYGVDPITVPPEASTIELGPYGAYVKWTVSYVEDADQWALDVSVFNFGEAPLENVLVNASASGNGRTYSSQREILVLPDTVYSVVMWADSPVTPGHSAQVRLVVEAPAPLGRFEETRSVTYNAYGGGTFGGDGA